MNFRCYRILRPVLAVALIVLLAACGTSRGNLRVSVKNTGLDFVSDVKVTCAEQEYVSPYMDPGSVESTTFTIIPEEKWVVEFYDPYGDKVSQEFEIYLRENYYGALEFQLDSKGTIRSVGNLYIN